MVRHRAPGLLYFRTVLLKPAEHMGLIEHHQHFAKQVSRFLADVFT